MDYFRKLLDLLEAERQEDRRSYQQLLQRTSVMERRESGLTWYPVAIRGTEIGRGDYLTVELERTTNQDISHQLRFGSSAALFSNHNSETNRVEGIISHQSGNKLRLTLRTDELPDWAGDGKLGIDLLFDENSYSEMSSALRQASAINEKSGNPLVSILAGSRQPGFEKMPPLAFAGLNESQNRVVTNIVAAHELAIVHGPPGTGKTTTLVQAIQTLLDRESGQILVVAPSNTAVDLLTEKLSFKGLNVLRIGNPVRVSEKLSALTLESKMSMHPSFREIRRLKKQAGEYRNLAHKYKRNFGKAEREQRKALFNEAHKLIAEVESIEQYIMNDVIGRAQVITATPVGSNHYSVRQLSYHTVVIDEAGQALEPACWIPIIKARKLVMAGDHFQLPPTIKSQEAAHGGLANTLLEKAAHAFPSAVVMLDEQYRMNELIMQYPSKVFYENRLKANVAVAQHTLLPGEPPLAFIDTAGCGFEEKSEGTSVTNEEEAIFLRNHLVSLCQTLSVSYNDENFPSIAVISPYRRQVLLLQDLILGGTELLPYVNYMSVNTIDSFQGQERDIVYISLVRCNNEGAIGFLSDIRRMNVAMTRARKKLIIIGDSATLSRDPFYDGLIAFSQQAGCWHSAWEWMS